MVVFAIEKPVFKHHFALKAKRREQIQRRHIILTHNGIELMEMKRAQSILHNLPYCSPRIAFFSVFATNDDTHLCPCVRWTEIHHIGNTHQ